MAAPWLVLLCSPLLPWGPLCRPGCLCFCCLCVYPAFTFLAKQQRKGSHEPKRKEPPASVSSQVKSTDLAGSKTSVWRGFVFYFIENRQLFHCAAAGRAGVYSSGHSAHHQVPCAGGTHHPEHRRYRRCLARRCCAGGLCRPAPCCNHCFGHVPLCDLSLVLWMLLGSGTVHRVVTRQNHCAGCWGFQPRRMGTGPHGPAVIPAPGTGWAIAGPHSASEEWLRDGESARVRVTSE